MGQIAHSPRYHHPVSAGNKVPPFGPASSFLRLNMSTPANHVSQPPSPQSAYIHVPFCRHRCGYCNFTLLAGRDELMTAYLDALERELQRQLVTPQPVSTIFFGGGTPTHLPPQLLERLLKLVRHWLPTSELGGMENAGVRAEISCEANPLDCNDERLQLLSDWGVNRLSIGGQSFSRRKLKLLERDHSPAELHSSLERCRNYFENISLDLIFAAPEETLAEWENDLRSATVAPIKHLSTYGLTIERGAAFYGRSLKQEIVEVDADLQLSMYEAAIDWCQAAGLQHYEVSNFARPNCECQHNLAYWCGRPWYAFGPGAASFTWDADEECMVRAVNHPSTTTYVRRLLAGKSPVHEREALTVEQRVRERLVFGLRTMQGVAFTELDQLLGRPAQELFEPFLSQYVEQGYLQLSSDTGYLQLTRPGLVISDSLWPQLL